MPALSAAMDGAGPAIALLAGSGATAYRSMIAAAVQPGRAVAGEIAVVASTSGSTGRPAGVLLPGTSLRCAAEAFAARSDRAAGHQWVAALPLHHAGGLMVAVRSVVAGTSPVAVPSLGGAQPFTRDGFAQATSRARALSNDSGRPLAVSLVPPMLALLDSAGSAGWDLLRAYDVVLVGGAAADPLLVERLRGAGVRVATSYGMTETAGGAVFDGRALPGTTVRTEPSGQLRICGAQVAAGYRDSRDAWRWQPAAEGTRCFRTADLGQVDADGLVTVTGRADDLVQVGGASVSLAAVRTALLADPRVVDAEVVALADRRFGVTLVALVVPTEPRTSGPPLAGLAEVVAARLGRAARPRLVQPLATLPMLPAGKPDRRALADLARRALESAGGQAGRDRIRP